MYNMGSNLQMESMWRELDTFGVLIFSREDIYPINARVGLVSRMKASYYPIREASYSYVDGYMY